MLSATAKYAISAMTHLASKDREKFFSVETLAAEVDVPQQYLAKIMKTLAGSGIIEARRGPTGGIRIAKSRNPLTLLNVCEALNEPIARDACFMGRDKCNAKDQCIFHKDWAGLRDQIREFLGSVELG